MMLKYAIILWNLTYKTHIIIIILVCYHWKKCKQANVDKLVPKNVIKNKTNKKINYEISLAGWPTGAEGKKW